MHQVDTARIGHLDLKTLQLLATLLETASVTRTSELMGMSQPAASRAVNRLRKAIGDPLLVRNRRGYALTTRAEELRPVVDAALAGIAHVFERTVFDPATARLQFRIATTDYGTAAVISPLVTRLARLAPFCGLEISPWSDDTLLRLERGSCDLALYADSKLPPDFHYRELFVESYAIVLRRGHPALRKAEGLRYATKRLLRALVEYPQAQIMYPEGARLAADNVLQRLGLSEKRAQFSTPYFMSAPWMLAETDFSICVPSRVAQRMSVATNLAVVPLPKELEPFGYRMIWHERIHRQPSHVWLRAQMVEVCRSS